MSLEAFFQGGFNGANLEIGSWRESGVFFSAKNENAVETRPKVYRRDRKRPRM